MQPPLTQCAAAILEQAQTEARQLNQEFVGTEHLVLALMGARNCHASQAMKRLLIDQSDVRSKLLAAMSRGQTPPIVTGRLPLSPRAQRAINATIARAQALGEPTVTTRILLLSLLEEPGAAFGATLKESGADIVALERTLSETPDNPES